MKPAGNRATPDPVESKTMKGFHMKRAFLDLAQDCLSLLAVAAFLGFATFGSAGISAAVIAWRLGQ
ncbi:MAG: hypothetical protein E5W90_31715 [Mesorhizobium sp.]|nr:MAG: hypothetical protein E5W90_31715 [Mesorhizobium sp.]TIW39470.1 MAG: hypothetical protein E5V71_14625 [Mesorhizobium sp.]